MAYNKIIYKGETLIDLTDLDVTEEDVASGKKFIKADGVKSTGTSTGGNGSSSGKLGQYINKSITEVTTNDLDGLTTIPTGAFESRRSLTSVTLPDSVTSIGYRAFRECIRLTSVTIPDSVTSIGYSAFENCNLTSVTIPSSVTYIGGYAFSGCSNLTSIVIPDSVTSIGDSAFSRTAYYNNDANWVDGVLYIGNYLIRANSSELLAEYTIKAGTKCIADSAFEGCSNLTSIVIPDSVTSIGDAAFQDCSSLTSITIPDSVTSIGDSAFWGCSSLTSVTIPDSVTSIGDAAFQYCSSLTSVTIPDSVTSIGDSAFEGCHSLTSVTIPYSVTGIGGYAFGECHRLKDVYYSGDRNSWNSIAISSYGNDYLTNATIHFTGGNTESYTNVETRTESNSKGTTLYITTNS